MVLVRKISQYKDDRGNVILHAGEPIAEGISILFRGSNNRLIVAEDARIRRLNLRFDCSRGTCVIGRGSRGVAPLQAFVRVGQDSRISIGDNVSTTNPVQLSAVEGTSIKVSDDVMIAGNVKIRGDDGHPIFDVHTGLRVNPAASIYIGDHVWLGIDSTVLGGSRIGEGSVVGTKALVKGEFPNNCIVAGVPARVIRRDIAWERPHLSLVEPYYKPDASSITKSKYWHTTQEQDTLGIGPARA